MQFHYVVGYDSDKNRWFVECDPDAYFPDCYVWDDNKADEYGYGWTVPKEGSSDEALDYELFKTLQYIVSTFPIPQEV